MPLGQGSVLGETPVTRLGRLREVAERAGVIDRRVRSLPRAHHRLTVHPASWPRPDSEGMSLSASTSATLRTRAGRRGNDRHRRPPLASLAPHQPRPARDAADAVERGGVIRWSGSSSGAYAVLVQQVHDVLLRNDVGEPNTVDARIADSPCDRRCLCRYHDSDDSGILDAVDRPAAVPRIDFDVHQVPVQHPRHLESRSAGRPHQNSGGRPRRSHVSRCSDQHGLV